MNFIKNTTISNFCLLLTLSFILIFATSHFILTPSFYKDNGEQLSALSPDSATPYSGMLEWIYLFQAVYLIIKLSIVSLILYTALYLRNAEVRFWRIFNVVTVAEYLFVVAAFVKIVYFSRYYAAGTLLDWHRVYMLSALSLFEAVPADWFYPLQTLNLFEVAYWFLLAWGIARTGGMEFDKALNVVATSYLPALLIWVACVVFCTLMFFPQQG